MITLSGIFSAPIKSFALIPHQEVYVGYKGLLGDRRFYLIDSKGKLITQRNCTRLALIRCGFLESKNELSIILPDGRIIRGEPALGRKIRTMLWGRRFNGHIVDGDWNDVISEFCGFQVKLVKSEFEGNCYDEYPLSILSKDSAKSLESKEFQDIDIRRFRPSILIDGLNPFEENQWIGSSISIGNDLVVQIEGKDPRCSIVSNNPNDGFQDGDMLAHLRHVTSDIYLGVYGLVVKPGRIAIGDQISVNI